MWLRPGRWRIMPYRTDAAKVPAFPSDWRPSIAGTAAHPVAGAISILRTRRSSRRTPSKRLRICTQMAGRRPSHKKGARCRRTALRPAGTEPAGLPPARCRDPASTPDATQPPGLSWVKNGIEINALGPSQLPAKPTDRRTKLERCQLSTRDSPWAHPFTSGVTVPQADGRASRAALTGRHLRGRTRGGQLHCFINAPDICGQLSDLTSWNSATTLTNVPTIAMSMCGCR